MITVKIKAYNTGLVFKNNRYRKMIKEGVYWLAAGENVLTFDMAKSFNPPIELNILLQDAELAAALYVEKVGNNELLIVFENGLFKSVLGAGVYAWWRGIAEYTFVRADISKYEITELSDRTLFTRAELMAFVRVQAVESYERAMLFVDGTFTKELAPGIYYFWKNPVVLTVYKVDTRQLQVEMSGQEILTKDKANLRINFSFQYKVTDILKAMANKEYDRQLYVLMQLALREQTAVFTLDELLEKKDTISGAVLACVQDKAAQLGVDVGGCGIRDIILPGDIKDIMNQVLVAEKKAQANVIMRREETGSTRSLLNTAKLMEDNEMLFKLKEMEYVERIADKINSISLSGGGDLVSQLKQIFVPAKK